MIKIGEAIDRVQSLYSKGVRSNDSRLSSRHIYSVLKSIRATLISNQVKKRQFSSDVVYMTLPCVKMIPVNSIECSCFNHLGCTIYRSKEKLPAILTDLNRHLVEYVMKVDNNYIIEPTFKGEYLYNKGNKYTKGKLKYIIENGYLYINSQSAPGFITIRFIPQDPIEAQTFKNECEDSNGIECVSIPELNFMLEESLFTPLTQMASQELIEVFSQMREDKTNNSSDSLTQESK